jgi:LacI family transcriptional regulator
MAATIKDIAKKTGLGYATISAYLNGVQVRPKNKKAIEEAIEELGYVRNEYARGLKTRRTMTIGVLIPELSNTFSTAVITEVEDILRLKGYGIIVCDCRTNVDMERESLKFLMSKMVDGLIVIPIYGDGKLFAPAIERDIPIVVIDRQTTESNASYILINNREVSREAVNCLIEKGHKNIALITGSPSIFTAYERRMGYQEALYRIGCFNEDYIHDGRLTIEGGYLAMKQIMDCHHDITALFTTNYDMSVGAIIAINEFGRRIPEDYSFVGFDNQDLSRVFTPKLATVNQPLIDIGRKAAEEIIKRIEGSLPQTIILEAEIERGASIKEMI